MRIESGNSKGGNEPTEKYHWTACRVERMVGLGEWLLQLLSSCICKGSNVGLHCIRGCGWYSGLGTAAFAQSASRMNPDFSSVSLGVVGPPHYCLLSLSWTTCRVQLDTRGHSMTRVDSRNSPHQKNPNLIYCYFLLCFVRNLLTIYSSTWTLSLRLRYS